MFLQLLITIFRNLISQGYQHALRLQTFMKLDHLKDKTKSLNLDHFQIGPNTFTLFQISGLIWEWSHFERK